VRPVEVLVCDGARLRVGPWRGHEEVAYLAPAANTPPCRPDAARDCLGELAERGYRQVITAALPPLDQAGFLAVGFEVREHLHLLALDLTGMSAHDLPTRGPSLVRRARRADRSGVLDVDHEAFGAFWHLDEAGLRDALAATPVARFRVIADGPVVAYAITGRAGRRGYIQRLAVRPSCQRAGRGRELLADSLRWLRRRGVRTVMVNTQESNAAALALYERHGFARQPGGLAVLTADVS
jgi:ribosomal protein S18 acetylase RimI-like enzyme